MKNRSCNNCRDKNFCFVPKIIIAMIIIILLTRFILDNASLFYRKSIDMPFSMHLNVQDLVLIKGEKYHLSVFGLNKRVSYSSTNFRVAGVNFLGGVYAYHTGKAYIIAKVDGKKLKCRVRVIDINKTTLRLKVGRSSKLKINGAVTHINWKSSNCKVAVVSFQGNVKAIGKGSTVITARVKGKILKCKVRVR